MGVTIQKYLTRIGSYNLAKTVKVGICNLEGIFWNIIPILILLNRSVFLIGYIVYVALLLRMANDVDEKPGPTVYDIVEPSQTICADFSQGNRRQFGQSAGKQCVAMSLTAIIHTQVKDITTWDSIFLNTILSVGNNLYTCISKFIKKSLLLLTDVPELISVHNNVYY